MTQALSTSMLMLGADITLTSDTKAANSLTTDGPLPQTDDGKPEQGSGFSALLNGMVQPAKSGKAGSSSRQIPAAASELSAISAAMLQATAQDAEAADTEDTALANSLLLQIALKNQNSDEADTASNVIAIDGDAMAEAAAPETDTAAVNGLAAKQQQALAMSAADGDPDAVAAGENAVVTDDGSTNSDQTKHAGGDIAATKSGAVAVDVAASGTPSDSKTTTMLAQAQPQSSVAGQSDDAALADAAVVASQQNQHADTAEPASTHSSAGPDIADAAKSRAAAPGAGIAKSADAATTTIDTAQQAKEVLTAEPVATAISAQAKVAASKTDDKQLVSSSDSEKTSSKAETASMLKSVAAEQGAQQQQQGQAQAERQFSTMTMHNSMAKTTPEPARVENSFAASLHAAENRQQTQTSKTVTKTATEQLKQSINLQQHDAAGQLRERVSLMVRQNIQIAEIRLDPAGLGQMQIKIDMQQEQASVQFIVQQPQAKELLEQQLPRLREMLQQQGIVLGEGSVQQQSQQERQLSERQQQGKQGQQHGTAEDGLPDDSIQTQLKVAPTDRLVDYYA